MARQDSFVHQAHFITKKQTYAMLWYNNKNIQKNSSTAYTFEKTLKLHTHTTTQTTKRKTKSIKWKNYKPSLLVISK